MERHRPVPPAGRRRVHGGHPSRVPVPAAVRQVPGAAFRGPGRAALQEAIAVREFPHHVGGDRVGRLSARGAPSHHMRCLLPHFIPGMRNISKCAVSITVILHQLWPKNIVQKWDVPKSHCK